MSDIALLVIYCGHHKAPLVGAGKNSLFRPTGNVARLIEVSRKRNHMVVHVMFVPEVVAEQTSEEDLTLNDAGEVVLTETDRGTFFSDELTSVLKQENVKQLVVCGALTRENVSAAAKETGELGYPMTVIYDACCLACLDVPGQKDSINFLERAFFASYGFFRGRVITTQDYLEETAA